MSFRASLMIVTVDIACDFEVDDHTVSSCRND